MGQLIKFKARNTPRTIDKLLIQASESHMAIHRLMAQARLKYTAKTDKFDFDYVRDLLAEIEGFINNTSRYLEIVQDQQAELSITGNLPIEMLRERRQKLDERINAYERLHPRLVVAQLKQG